MSEETNNQREALTNAMTKAIKAAKRLGYSIDAFTSMASIAFSTYSAGENDAKQSEKKATLVDGARQ